MRYFFLSLCGILCLFSVCGYGQNEMGPPTIVPPSPEASSLFKFTETPVNLSQGMATTEVPIYTIKTKGVSIPISLSYHSRGIKVSEVASRVGLGWTLNYGGMISRQVRGKSDDGNPYGYLRQSFYNDFFTNENTRNSVYLMDVNYGMDFDPDLFFFNFPGYTGKFIFDQVTGEPWQQKYSDIQILHTKQSGIITDWTIKDDKGNTYYFGAIAGVTPARDSEATAGYRVYGTNTVGQVGAPGDDGYSGWHLLKIVTYEKEVITFTYEVENPRYVRRSYDENDPNVQGGVVSYYSVVTGTQYQIKRIDFPGGWVLFNKKSTARADLPGSYALDNIEVYAKGANSTSSQVSRHNLSYQDVNSSINSNYHTTLVNEDASSHKRMYLTSVRQVSGSESLPPYSFEYSSIKLPNRFSNSQDNWGYFNNAANGPYLSFYDYGNYSMDRRVDTLQNEAGLLKKVIYPTEGSVSYVYEQNVAVKPSFLDQTVSPGNNPVVAKSVFMGHLMQDKFDPNTNTFKIPIEIGSGLVGSVTSNVKFTYDDGDGPCQNLQSTAECSFSMLLKGEGKSYLLRYGNNISLVAGSGSYVLEVFPPGGNPNIYFEVGIYWEEEEPTQDSQGQELMLASGKRIKKVIYSDGGAVLKTKEYTYSYPNGANSGKIFGLPTFFSINPDSSINAPYKYGNKPGSPLTSLQGNELGYSYVAEYEGTPTSNMGKTEYEFTNISDAGSYHKFPYHLPIDNEWLRGKLLQKTIFKKNGTSYLPVHKITNQYLYGDLDTPIKTGYEPLVHADSMFTFHKNRRSYALPLAVFTPDDEMPDGHAYKAYHQLGGTLDLLSTTETSYLNSDSGSQNVTSTTTNNYDYSNHYQIKGTSTTSDGQTTQITYFYSLDESSTELNALVAANRIIPIRTETAVMEGTTLMAKNKQRTLFSDSNGIIFPAVIETEKRGETYAPRVNFHRYDNVGNPLEVSKAGGPITVYIWGYDKQNPVAKIENSTYAAVESLSGFGAGFNLGSAGLTEAQKSALRTLPGALVTTYDHQPLVGVTVVTDPNGNKATYKYDSFNRLEEVYDQNGHILKKINYHFKTN